MKIIHVINSLAIGGAEKLIADSLPIYQSKGIEISLLTLTEHQSFLTEMLNAHGIPCHSLNLKSVYNPWAIILLLPFLKKADLIHVHLFPAQYWVAFAKILSFSKIAIVFTEHNTNNRRWGKFYFKPFDLLVYNSYQQICCITEQVAHAFKRNFKGLNHKIKVIENGINVKLYSEFKTDVPTNLPPSLKQDDQVLIQVAAFRPEKDQDTLIKSLLLLPQNVKLLLVGVGQRKVICEQLVNQLGLTDRVFFLGARSDVPELLRYARLVVQSSHWEGFGLVAAEAMASGTPILGSNVPGLAEVIGHKQLLFEKGNQQDLALKISELLNSSTLYDNIKLYCEERVLKYDINTMVNHYIALYQLLILKNS